jgi:uncharacterized protein (TIGR01244 family)
MQPKKSALSLWILLPLFLVGRSPAAVAQDEREIASVLPAASADFLLGEWRKVERREELLSRMGLADGDLVADVGAGLGWYSLEAAKRVGPRGTVFAVDIQEGMLDRLRQRMDEAQIRNIHPVLSTETSPLLPPGKMDWVLLVDAYHEFSKPTEMLAGIKASLAPGGRVALLEYRSEQRLEDVLPFPRTAELEKHFMSVKDVMREWTAAGFELEERAEFLPTQHVFIFKAAGDTTAGTWRGGQSIKAEQIGTTPNVSSFGGDLYFAGQVAAEDIEQFKKLGVTTIVNLRTQGEMDNLGFDEAGLAEAAGMKYVHVPMGAELPAQEQLDQVLDIITRATAGDGKVLVHCAGASRVGGVWTAFRCERHGLSVEESLAEGQRIGMHSRGLEQQLKARYGPR